MREPAFISLFLFSACMIYGQDVGVVAITSPVNGCLLGNKENVTIQVFNDDTAMLNTAFDVTCIISGPVSDSVTETISSIILSKSVFTYTFVKKASLSASGSYAFRCYTSLAGDTDPSDDTLKDYVVASDTLSEGGLVSDSGRVVCMGMNDSVVQLTGHRGGIVDWERSVNGGSTWTGTGNTDDTLRYINLAVPAWYRVIVKNGLCPADTSSVSVIAVDSPAVGGAVTGGATVCASGNGGTLTLAGHYGSVSDWETSTDGGGTWMGAGVSGTTYTYINLTATTQFRALVSNGACPAVPAQPATVSVDQPSAGGSLTGGTAVCPGTNSGSLQLTGHNGTILRWEFSADSGSTWTLLANNTASENYVNLTVTTWYRAIVRNGVCTEDTSLTAVVNMLLLPAADAGNDTVIRAGDTIMLSGAAGGAFYWTPGASLSDSTAAGPKAFPSSTTIYYLHVTDSNGCTAADSIRISVTPAGKPADFEPLITNTITANGDGINDTWYIEGIETTDADVVVFNGQGNEVFRSAAYANEWDGRWKGNILPDGTYYYVVRYGAARQVFKGTLTILGKGK